MIRTTRKAIAAAVAVTVSFGALAAVSAEEAKLLDGPTYTPWGAERAGNKEGTIPEWTGERIAPPPAFDPKNPSYRPDPFASDKILFTITSQNYQQYADKLSAGQKQMFKVYPDFRMNVYQSRRTTAYPKWLNDFTKKNVGSCRTITTEAGPELGVAGCWGGTFFPFPKTGAEVVWNHATRYQLRSWVDVNSGWIVDTAGRKTFTSRNEGTEDLALHDPKRTKPAEMSDVYYKLQWEQTAPARTVGNKYVLLFTLDNHARIWQYIPGQRRVKLAPDLAYDTPTPVSGGATTMDEAHIFYGAMDRYNFKLVGKQEKYIPYNSFKINDYKNGCANDDVLTARFQNPDCMRWELHRVWVVQMTLKPGFRHIMPTKTVYWDEDSWGAGLGDSYDSAGKIYRMEYQYQFPYYDAKEPGVMTNCATITDFQTGIYNPICSMADSKEGNYEIAPLPEVRYSPEALAGSGIR